MRRNNTFGIDSFKIIHYVLLCRRAFRKGGAGVGGAWGWDAISLPHLTLTRTTKLIGMHANE